jgi:hypothetical protein
MRRVLWLLAITLLVFSLGAIAGARWKARRTQSRTLVATSKAPEEKEWPLYNELVARSLQSHSFRTDKLRRNSNDEVVWRWLKESIADYPQNWVELHISDNETYGVVIYSQKVLQSEMFEHYNRELSGKGLPLLKAGQRYLPIDVYHEDVICPSWSGLVDVEEARLVYFLGVSG